MADDAQSMSQEDIDALLASLGGGDASAASRPAEPTVPAAAAATSVDQAELDRLLAALDETPVKAAPAVAISAPADNGGLGQEDIDALIAGLSGEAPAPTPAPAAPTGPLGQDDIDAMIAGLSGGAPAAPAPAAPAGPLGQDDIDAMIAGLSGGAPAPAAAPAAPEGPLGQDDIDAMIAGLSGGAPAPAAAPEGPLGQDDIDAMIAGLSGGAPTAPPAPAPAPAPVAAAPAADLGGQLDQSSIDALVASLGTAAAPAASFGDQPTIVAQTPEPPAAPGHTSEAGLSTDVVDALVAKHAATPDEGGEGMIAQSDIDALVKSLGGPPADQATAPMPPSMTEQLARHDDAIDQLLAGAGPAGGAAMATMDAIDVKAELGRGSAGTPTSAVVAHRPNSIPALPVDLRGARWMLLAAVVLLSVCCGTLVVVAGAVKTLAAELKAERTANLAPTDNYSDDFKAALLRLGSPQSEEVAKGVLFLQRLKKRYPSHETEIGLELARHFRAHGSWREARREYAAIVEETSALQDDPRVHLEYAETLARVKERTSAVRQVNLMLANEAAFVGETTANHLPRPQAEIVANGITLQEAQLLLGRLLSEDDGRRTVAALGHGEASASSHEAPAHGEHAAPSSHEAAPAAHGAASHGEAH